MTFPVSSSGKCYNWTSTSRHFLCVLIFSSSKIFLTVLLFFPMCKYNKRALRPLQLKIVFPAFLSFTFSIIVFGCVTSQDLSGIRSISTKHTVHKSYRAQNMSVTNHIGHKTCRPQIISDTKHVGHKSYRAQNMSVTNHIGHKTCRSQIISGTKHVVHKSYRAQIMSEKFLIFCPIDFGILLPTSANHIGHKSYWAQNMSVTNHIR